MQSESENEMSVPEVSKKLVKELEALGFSFVQAAQALHHSGNASVEDAVNWIIDHENDAETDQMPLVAINIEIESPEPDHMTDEEMKMKAQQLRDRARQKKEEEEKKLERETEKERIRAGRELLRAKRIAEENERKRFLALRKAEKEEEKRARKKILEKLEADKLERRKKLGFPSENSAAVKSSTPMVGDNMPSSPALSLSKFDQMRECLRSLKRNHKDEDARVKRAFQTLLIYVGNVVKNPKEEKYRKIRLSNPLFLERVGSLEGGTELCGFEITEGGDFLFLPQDKVDMATLNLAGTLLRSAMTNPFFGLLSG